ncbi:MULTISPECIES: cytochrome c maturation protein CcmE [Alcaligenaceae]|jgi:cytochrome c-type biogenesis protein CcmE|uniref:Cytochrome c-type biogenesis protein CcmE n=1 Tax=Pollutimonas thiosulfatoxidans TaxID=2028345 RepID=A0A410GCC9_9BURK|nr:MULTISPECIES: cytochrome c maturation protein CcmE [Alcaligenaceae]QAA93940.1 cytochrome c biogenesis protein CcmE [Pollutimonas thiosulfatoxidans]TEA79701.1 cytochrome c maturation protein CcmE [Allopusillimonas ginsengisoli]TFL14314.1 cytochrome c maturation protein CcmE [Pusillimonas caeni]UTM02326.1 cytochrome c maturation protein CcmE [Alcaligenes sp. NLF5-7]
MKKRHQRSLLIGGGLAAIAIATALVLNAFQNNLVFFFTPTQVNAGEAPQERLFRVGGIVQAGSVRRDGLTVQFVVTDNAKTVPVSYTGILPDLFSEGKGVVVQGRLELGGRFLAQEVLAKHDENYMPPEAQHALNEAEKATNAGRP